MMIARTERSMGGLLGLGMPDVLDGLGITELSRPAYDSFPLFPAWFDIYRLSGCTMLQNIHEDYEDDDDDEDDLYASPPPARNQLQPFVLLRDATQRRGSIYP